MNKIQSQTLYELRFSYNKKGENYEGKLVYRIDYETNKGNKVNIGYKFPNERLEIIRSKGTNSNFPIKLYVQELRVSWDDQDPNHKENYIYADAKRHFNLPKHESLVLHKPKDYMSFNRQFIGRDNRALILIRGNNLNSIEGTIKIDLKFKLKGKKNIKDDISDIKIPILIEPVYRDKDEDDKDKIVDLGNDDSNTPEGENNSDQEKFEELQREWGNLSKHPTIDKIEDFRIKLSPYLKEGELRERFNYLFDKANNLEDDLETKEEVAYERVIESNDVNLLENYVSAYRPQKYNNKRRVDKVKSRLNTLYDKASLEQRMQSKYKLAEKGDKVDSQAFLDFCKKNPGACSKSAQEDIALKIYSIEDEAAWETAGKKNTISSYLGYIRKFKNGKYISEANKKYTKLRSALDAKELYFIRAVQRNMDVTLYINGGYINSAVNPFNLVVRKNSAILELKKAKWEREDGKTYLWKGTISNLTEGDYKFIVSDSKNKRDEYSFEVTTPESPKISLSANLLQISDGQPEFKVVIRKENHDVQEEDIQFSTTFQLSNLDLGPGDYQILVRDVMGRDSNVLDWNVSGFYIPAGILVTGIIFVLVWAIFLAYYFNEKFKTWVKINLLRQPIKGIKSKDKPKKIQAKIRENSTKLVEEIDKDSNSGSKIKISSKRQRRAQNDRKSLQISSKDIALKDYRDLEQIQFFQNIISGDLSSKYYDFSKALPWKDSMVEKILIKRDAVIDIDRYIIEEHHSNKGFDNGVDNEIPEVGGFLMGKYLGNPNEKYIIAIEQFVKSSSHDDNTVYQVAFEEATWNDYNKALELYPNLTPLGWFHTHPGHGLFLSRNDMKVHGQFPKPYQIAMEIDDKSKNFDVAFFTYTGNGLMNNTSDTDINWYSWIDVQSWIRGVKS